MKFNKKQMVKRFSAVALAAVVAGSSCLAGFPSTENPLSTVNAESQGVLPSDERGVIYADSRTDFRDESIYFLITTRFYDGDKSNNFRSSEDEKAHNPEDDPSWRGDFKGLIEQLDYIKALGFTAIWITPVVQNDSGYDYHGYHASDFNAVDYRYESNGVDYQTLIDACHSKGIKVIQDVVFNHTCNFGEKGLKALGGEALEKQLSSNIYGERNQVVMNGKGDPLNIYHHNAFCGGGDWDNYEAQRKTIADDCFDLETENPVVYNYITDAYKKYIDMGVDAFRVDTVKHMSRLTLNTAILPELTDEAEKIGNDDFYMFGEVCTKGHDVWYRDAPPISTPFYTWDLDDSYKARWSDTDLATNEALVEEHYQANLNTSSQPTSTNAFLNGNDYHTPDYSQSSDLGVIDFQMHWSFMNANDAFNTAKYEDQYFNDSTWNVVYVDSHDYAPDNCQTQRYTGGTDAWAENLDLMFTFRGIPCVFYGSEVEFQAGCPIDVGPNKPLNETGRAYYGDYLEGNVDTPSSTLFTEFGNVSGKVKDTLSSPLSQQMIRLNRIRQAVPALRKGQYSTEGCNGNIAFKRRYTDDKTDSFALVAISGDATFTGIPNGRYVDAVTGDVKTVSNGTLSATVNGKGNMKVYVLDTDKTKAPGRVVPNGRYLTDGGSSELLLGENIAVEDPSSICLDKETLTIPEEEKETVKATVLPAEANQTVTWSSSNEEVAVVANGVITAKKAGNATITAKTVNGLTKTVEVKVTTNPYIIYPTGVKLDTIKLELDTKGTAKLNASLIPENATRKNVSWSSSDEKVATVDKDGNVKAVGEGSATITVKTEVGAFTASCEVNVTKNSKDIKIYFKNTSNWSTVNAYAWDGSKNPIPNNANWPGEAMKKEKDNVYSITLDGDIDFDHIIFNNGSSKTDDLVIGKDGEIYDKGKWSPYNGEQPNPEKIKRIYFKNTSNWDNVYAYNWTKNTNNAVCSWPGTKMTFDSKADLYYIDIDENLGHDMIIFTNNKGAQTKDLSLPSNDDNSYSYADSSWSEYDGKIDPVEKVRVYFQNTANWKTVYAYVWKKNTNKAVKAWPGEMMQYDSESDLYYIDVDVKAGYNMIIFTNGSGTQTKDLEITDNNIFIYKTGKWSKK